MAVRNADISTRGSHHLSGFDEPDDLLATDTPPSEVVAWFEDRNRYAQQDDDTQKESQNIAPILALVFFVGLAIWFVTLMILGL